MRLFGIDGRLAPYYTGACWRLGLAFGLPICALVGLAVGMGHGIESIILQVTVCVVGLVVIYGVVTDVWPIIAWLRCATETLDHVYPVLLPIAVVRETDAYIVNLHTPAAPKTGPMVRVSLTPDPALNAFVGNGLHNVQAYLPAAVGDLLLIVRDNGGFFLQQRTALPQPPCTFRALLNPMPTAPPANTAAAPAVAVDLHWDEATAPPTPAPVPPHWEEHAEPVPPSYLDRHAISRPGAVPMHPRLQRYLFFPTLFLALALVGDAVFFGLMLMPQLPGHSHDNWSGMFGFTLLVTAMAGLMHYGIWQQMSRASAVLANSPARRMRMNFTNCMYYGSHGKRYDPDVTVYPLDADHPALTFHCQLNLAVSYERYDTTGMSVRVYLPTHPRDPVVVDAYDRLWVSRDFRRIDPTALYALNSADLGSVPN